MEQNEYDKFLADACSVVDMLNKYKINNIMEAEGAGELLMAVNGEYDEFKTRVDMFNSYGRVGVLSGENSEETAAERRKTFRST